MEDVIIEALNKTEEKICELSDEVRADYFSIVNSLARQAAAIAAVSVIHKHKLPLSEFPYGCLCDVANGHHLNQGNISARFTVDLMKKD